MSTDTLFPEKYPEMTSSFQNIFNVIEKNKGLYTGLVTILITGGAVVLTIYILNKIQKPPPTPSSGNQPPSFPVKPPIIPNPISPGSVNAALFYQPA